MTLIYVITSFLLFISNLFFICIYGKIKLVNLIGLNKISTYNNEELLIFSSSQYNNFKPVAKKNKYPIKNKCCRRYLLFKNPKTPLLYQSLSFGAIAPFYREQKLYTLPFYYPFFSMKKGFSSFKT